MKYSLFRHQIKDLPVFSTSMLGTLTKNVRTLKTQFSMWKKKGLIHSLRKGLYVLNPEDRQIEPPLFYLANQIFLPSYVSLESALAYHGLIPEFVAATTSVTVRKTCRFENEFGLFTYQHIHSEGYGGFESVQESEKLLFLIAAPEKAVIDFIYLNLAQFRLSKPSIFEESFRFQNCKGLNPEKLRAFAARFRTKKLSAIVELFIETLIQ